MTDRITNTYNILCWQLISLHKDPLGTEIFSEAGVMDISASNKMTAKDSEVILSLKQQIEDLESKLKVSEILKSAEIFFVYTR